MSEEEESVSSKGYQKCENGGLTTAANLADERIFSSFPCSMQPSEALSTLSKKEVTYFVIIGLCLIDLL
jgi:hypothetical protein